MLEPLNMVRSRGFSWGAAMLLAAIGLPALGAGAGQDASYFKWTDAHGTVHVSTTPPPGGKATELKVKEAGHAGEAVAPATLPSLAPTEELKQAQAQYRQRSCQAAHNDLRLLGQHTMVVSGKTPDAATKLDAEQRAQAKLRAQQRVIQFCDAK